MMTVLSVTVAAPFKQRSFAETLDATPLPLLRTLGAYCAVSPGVGRPSLLPGDSVMICS